MTSRLKFFAPARLHLKAIWIHSMFLQTLGVGVALEVDMKVAAGADKTRFKFGLKL